MKKLLSTLVCAALLVMATGAPAFAVGGGPPVSPAPQGGFPVLVNGEPVSFPDAQPQMKNGDPCLPFVAVFEQLGFSRFTWDGAARTVTAAKGDLTLSMVSGSTQFSILIPGAPVRTYVTEAAPYVDPACNRTYVPYTLVADFVQAAKELDYAFAVGWDAQAGAAMVDDVDAILAANTETYELMDQYMAYSRSFYEENLQITGAYYMEMNIDGSATEEPAVFDFAVEGDYEMLMSGPTAFQFDTDMVMDMLVEENGVDVTDELLGEDAALFPLTVDMDMRGDLLDGVFYFQSDALSQMMGLDAWFKMDLKAIMDQMSAVLGMDYAALMELSLSSMEMGFEESLAATLASMPLVSAEATTADTLAIMNSIVGNSAFVKDGGAYVSTLEQDGVLMTFTLYADSGKVDGYAVEISAEAPSSVLMEVFAAMRGESMDSGIMMRITLPEMPAVNLAFLMDGVYQATSLKPVTTPPADAPVIDLIGLVGIAEAM